MTVRSLSQDRILDSATELMHRSGVDALTIRGLAEALEVTPMAIYRHFENKDELLSALLDRFITQTDVIPKVPLSWDQWLQHVGVGMWAALTREPGWMTLVASARVRIGGIEVLAACMDVMEGAGFTAEQTTEAFFTLVHISVGAACLQARLNKMEPSQVFDASNQEAVARVLRNVNQLETLRDAHRVERSIDLLIDGLRARLPVTS